MDTARYTQRSDQTLNPHVRRRWNERSRLRPGSTDDAEAADPALAVNRQEAA